MKKLLVLVLALCMLLSVMPALSLAEDYAITLRVEMYDRSIAGFNVEDCWQLHYIQENFGDPNGIKVEWVPASRWSEGEVLSRWLQGGTAPDICMTYGTDLLQQYIDQGGVRPLDELLEEYGQDLTDFLGASVLQYGQFDTGSGLQQYYLPARRIIVATQSMYIREDWLEELGMEVPENVEELHDYLLAAKDANLGGERTIPYSSDLYAADPFYGWIYQMDSFIDYDQITEEDWVAYAEMHYLLPGAKEAIRWMNTFYNEGLVTDYFGIGNSEQTDADRVLGLDGFWVGNWDVAWRMEYMYQQELSKNVEGGKWLACDAFKAVDGPTLHETYTAAGQAIFIPATTDDETAIAAIKYLNWMASPEALYALQNGEMGHTYTTVDDNGIPTDLKNIADVEDAYKIHATDGAPICNGYYYGSDELNYAASANGYPGYTEEVAHSLVVSNTGAYEPITFTRTIQSRVDYGTTISSKEGELLVQAVTCAPDAFDTVWDEYVNAILTSGGQQIIDEQREAYAEGAYRGFYPMAD
ncbi:MAG: extracellular solute-binding protein [Clostridia bacterium]|nr:extracellular solute-binding protein [Clostridia bacterium]